MLSHRRGARTLACRVDNRVDAWRYREIRHRIYEMVYEATFRYLLSPTTCGQTNLTRLTVANEGQVIYGLTAGSPAGEQAHMRGSALGRYRLCTSLFSIG